MEKVNLKELEQAATILSVWASMEGVILSKKLNADISKMSDAEFTEAIREIERSGDLDLAFRASIVKLIMYTTRASLTLLEEVRKNRAIDELISGKTGE